MLYSSYYSLFTVCPNDSFEMPKIVAASYEEHRTLCLWQIKQIILEGITVPDGENDLRKQQLRELALLNGTLREDDALTYDVFIVIVA